MLDFVPSFDDSFGISLWRWKHSLLGGAYPQVLSIKNNAFTVFTSVLRLTHYRTSIEDEFHFIVDCPVKWCLWLQRLSELNLSTNFPTSLLLFHPPQVGLAILLRNQTLLFLALPWRRFGDITSTATSNWKCGLQAYFLSKQFYFWGWRFSGCLIYIHCLINNNNKKNQLIICIV
jgi:hypothetical protein